jgi:hypothetical protein
MIIQCGPSHDTRIFSLNLPISTHDIKNPTLKKILLKKHNLISNDQIGILVSGGIDSAILYYLLIKENIETGQKFNITPYTILRKEGSKHYAIKVLNWIHRHYGLPETQLNVVGDPTLPEIQQVESGITEILHKKIDYIYVGIIEARPEHSVGWFRFPFTETFHRRYPLLNLQKSHVIDLYRKFDVMDLLSVTHSCAVNELVPCGTCNGCNEKNWGLSELGLVPRVGVEPTKSGF